MLIGWRGSKCNSSVTRNTVDDSEIRLNHLMEYVFGDPFITFINGGFNWRIFTYFYQIFTNWKGLFNQTSI